MRFLSLPMKRFLKAIDGFYYELEPLKKAPR